MRHAPSTLHFSTAYPTGFGRPSASGAIEWEELPSLVGTLGRRLAAASNASPWDATRPAELDVAPPPSQPFREPVDGLALREVTEPDVFRHFFGAR